MGDEVMGQRVRCVKCLTCALHTSRPFPEIGPCVDDQKYLNDLVEGGMISVSNAMEILLHRMDLPESPAFKEEEGK